MKVDSLMLLRRGLSVSTLILVTSLSYAAVIEEVVVTAQKREQNLQDVGISVTAFSGEQLDALGIDNAVDITQQIPGLQLNTFNPGLTTLNLRGISQNNFTDTLEAPIAVYVDGAYTASMNAISAQLFDMERVEVLRGPQGTLFGRNATGGLVHYLTRKADDDEFNGYVEGSISEYSKYTVESAAGGALTDNVRARVAARWETADGYVESVGDPSVRDAHGLDGYALRGTLQMDFSDDLVGDFKVAYSKDDDVPSGAYTIGGAHADASTGFGIGLVKPADPHSHTSGAQGYLDRDILDVTGTFTWNLNNDMELISITNWKDIDKDYLEDADGGAGLPFDFTARFLAKTEQFSQELRLNVERDRSRWTLGAYYLNLDIDSTVTATDAPFLPFTFAGGPVDSVSVNTQLDSRNWSIFGQGEYDLNDEWTAIAGLRFSQDDKEIDWNAIGVTPGGATIANFNGANMSTLLATNPGLDEIDYGDVAARFQMNWTPNDDLLLFASFNRGIKGGNWTPPVTSDTTVLLKHGEEVLLSYELGAKWTLPNGLGRINATTFYYDYSDYQAFSFNANIVPQVSNSDAMAYGGEIELFLAPARGWDVVLGAAFMDSEVDEIPDLFGGTVSDVKLPNAPTISLNWLGRYEWPVFSGAGMMSAQLDGNFNSEQFLLGTNADATAEDPYSVWNANITFKTKDEKWKTSLFVKNLTDEEYRIYSLDLAIATGTVTDVYAPPRWFGASLSYNF
ncbi:MAG: TonB-dependent receptor [Proteobacteria bacterium]|nr:TonB-dependent receptor [Pseudomonadota bacterium]NOG59569.1 TonB-dependent receptor [Pseudomonadota bacterium]